MNNPVMIKELRGRMRGIRAFAVLSAFLLFLSCFTILVYTATSMSLSSGSGPGVAAGKIVFFALFLFELFLVSFLTPALTAGAFSGERERRTHELLLSTPLRAREIVLGKFASALAYVVALVVASIPLMASAFLMGGVAPEEVAIAFWILLVTAILFGSIGLFFSSFLGNTVVSTVLSYAVVLILTVGVPIVFIVSTPFLGLFGRVISQSWIESLVFIYSAGLALCTNPFIAAGLTEGFYASGKSLFWFTESFGSVKAFIISPWLVFSTFYGLASLGLNLAAVVFVRRIK